MTRFEFIDKYKKVTFKFNDYIRAINSFLSGLVCKPNKIIYRIGFITSKVMIYLSKLTSKLVHGLGLIVIDFAKSTYNLARKMTIPTNIFWLIYIKWFLFKPGQLLFTKGVLFLVALQGGGKSSLLYHLIEEIRLKTGRGSYVNVDLEYAHYDPILDKDVNYHYRFDMEDFWSVSEDDGKKTYSQTKRFNNRAKTIVLDEWLSKMNHRMNMSGEYKAQFIPFITSLSHMRHQGIDTVYIASQISSTDIQLQSMFKLVFELEVVTGIPYWDWVRTGMLGSQIIGWRITAKRPVRKNGVTDMKKVRSWFKRCTVDMTNFNSLNMASDYYKKPTHELHLQKGI